MNRRSLLRSSGALIAGAATGALSAGAVVATAPAHAEAAADPLLALIVEYRTQLAIFNASALDMTNEENDALAASTMDGPWQRLRDDCPTPTTMEGAIEGVRLVTDELRDGGYGGIEHGVLAAVVAFFDGRA